MRCYCIHAPQVHPWDSSSVHPLEFVVPLFGKLQVGEVADGSGNRVVSGSSSRPGTESAAAARGGRRRTGKRPHLLPLASLLRAPLWRERVDAVEEALPRRTLMLFVPSPTAGALRQGGGGAPGAQVEHRYPGLHGLMQHLHAGHFTRQLQVGEVADGSGTEWLSPAAVGRGRSRRSRLGEVVQEVADGRESYHIYSASLPCCELRGGGNALTPWRRPSGGGRSASVWAVAHGWCVEEARRRGAIAVSGVVTCAATGAPNSMRALRTGQRFRRRLLGHGERRRQLNRGGRLDWGGRPAGR